VILGRRCWVAAATKPGGRARGWYILRDCSWCGRERERVVLCRAPAIAFLAGLDRFSTLLHDPHEWQGGDSILSRTGKATARGVSEVYVEGVLKLRRRLVLVVVQARLSEGSLNFLLDDEGLVAVGA
jgi:hypothetical protein